MKSRTPLLLKNLLTCLVLDLVSPTLLAQGPIELTSLLSTTNGATVAWTNPAPGYAYTVQVRESLASGGWRNATMRYRWPWPFTRWGDSPLNLPDARFYRVVAQPIAALNRGKLLTNRLRDQFDTNSLGAPIFVWGSNFIHPKFGIINRPFTYETIDPYGLPITASAMLILPKGANGPIPLLGVQHVTLWRKSDVPSQADDNWGLAFATYGYAVVATDYLGLGTSPGYQAYVHAKSEATCVVDALRAARTICASNHVTLNGQLFLTGYSQGGHVTMATHRELETYHTNEFTVTASAPCAGAYDIGGVEIDYILAGGSQPNPMYLALILASYLPIYHLADTLEEMLAEPYRRTLPPLLDGVHNGDQVAAVMPADMVQILRPDFQADFRTNVNNPLRQALLDNNTYAWAPYAPMKMFHCRGDRDSIFAAAEVAYQSFTNRGACCVSLVDPGVTAELDHGGCWLPSLRGVLEWFETLRQ